MSHSPNTPAQTITVQLVVALPHEQKIISIKVNHDSTAMDAVKQSGILASFPEWLSVPLKLGVFGKLITHDTTLEDGMRIEIYRPLIADPKETRRKRALLAKK
jgi:uncharacterized protein